MVRTVGRRQLYLTTAFTMVLAGQAGHIHAQDGVTTLDTLYVFGERVRTDLLDAEASITIIMEEELERANPNSSYKTISQSAN